MLAAPRPADGPLPGDLYLDPAVPECERLVLSRNGWSAQASHVWTGTGWTRLVPGVVRSVPEHPFAAPAAAAPVRPRRTGRRAVRPVVPPVPAQQSAAAAADATPSLTVVRPAR